MCNAEVAENVALVLSKYLYSLECSTNIDVDLSSKAMATKYRGDLESMRSGAQSLKTLKDNYTRRASVSSSFDLDTDDDHLMHPNDGNDELRGASFDLGISEHSDRGYDALSMEDRMEVTACRQLTSSEAMTLYKMMKANLDIVDEDADQDADTLLDYALDMVDEGASVGAIVNEVRTFYEQ